MEVSRVLMTAMTAAHTGDTIMVTSCGDTPIYPNDDVAWDCPHNNQIQWKNLGTPETIAPGKAKSFLVRVQPGELAIAEEPGATVTATVYTDIGIFTKAGYTIAVRDADAPLANVYLTDTTASTAENSDHMFGHLNDIPPGTSSTFRVAMADLDREADTYIEAGGRLIINVPPGFNNVAVTSWTNFANTPTVTVRADGITQIIGITTGGTGDGQEDEEAKVIEFTAITPSPTEDSMYIMHAFIDGITDDGPTNNLIRISSGAIAEIALQVNGTG
jgi:hypothetical protein